MITRNRRKRSRKSNVNNFQLGGGTAQPCHGKYVSDEVLTIKSLLAQELILSKDNVMTETARAHRSKNRLDFGSGSRVQSFLRVRM